MAEALAPRLGRLLKGPAGDPYAGADRQNAARLGALVVLITALLAGALVPVSLPRPLSDPLVG